MGDWTHTALPGGTGRVTFSLTRSRAKVTTVTSYLDGVLIDRPLIGDDLRNVGAMYFTLPRETRTYSLTVVAQTADGCSDGSGPGRAMSVVVQ